MNIVQPIRDKNKLEELKEELKKTGTRNYLMFLTGLNSGMRVSDVVNLTRDNIRNEDGTMKDHIVVLEKKTNKAKRFPLVNGLRIEMEKYTKNMKAGEYLFESNKGTNKPITTVQAYRIINNAANNIGLNEIGTHTMRKSFGYHHTRKS